MTVPVETVRTRCCIAGGGPAGMMLGLLLARAGVDTVVLEKHQDFLRDFRGDTVHPSTLEIVRERAGLAVEDLGAPMDVLWMRLSRRADDAEQMLGYLRDGHVFVMLDRGDYWQCGFVIAKGGYDELRRQGLEPLRKQIVTMV